MALFPVFDAVVRQQSAAPIGVVRWLTALQRRAVTAALTSRYVFG